MKRHNSDKRFTKLNNYLDFNFFETNSSVNKRFKSINFYKNNKLESFIRKTETNNKTQNIFEVINFQEILLNHYKNYKLYFDKPEENENKEEKNKYIKYDNILLGKGDFSKCYLFREMDKEDMNFYAGKIIKKKKISNIKKTLEQIDIQKEFKVYPKVVKVKDYFEDYKNIYIIQELCKNKSLANYLEQRGGRLTEIEVKCLIFQLLQGLKCLHTKRVIHRDLKPSNLLLDDKYELKIGDFENIAKITNDKKRRYTICGTYNYMAPEIFENNGKGYSFEVDIWSVGIIMYQLLTGKLPFNGENNEIQKNILSFQPENLDVSGISIVAADLIKQILVKNPMKRPGINQIIYHYFFHDTEFPKYLNPKIFEKIGKEKEEEDNKEKEEEKNKKLKIQLYSLIVDEIKEIEYENIKNYIIKENEGAYKYYITYYHKSTHYNLCYYEFNNEIIGIIDNYKENGSINMIYNTETKLFYEIIINKDDEDGDEIKRYTKEEIPEKLKKYSEIIISYNKLLSKKKNNIEVKEENPSIKEQNSSSQSTKISDQNLLLDKDNLIYVRKILSSDKATLLFLSDQTIEAIFKDKIKILMSERSNKIEVIDQDNKIYIVSTNTVFINSSNDFKNRLKYIRLILYNDLKKNIFGNIKENNQNKINNIS